MIWVGPINEEFLEKLLKSPCEDLVLSTQGGDTYLMQAAIDHLQGCPRKIVATGKCWSAGVPILACGKKRWATARTTFMAHRPAAQFPKGSKWMNDDLRVEVEQLNELGRTMVETMASGSKLTADAWEALVGGKDFWFTSEEAKKMGLIHKIV